MAAVTAVVPTLGRSPLLERCLQALRAQAGPETLEVLVVDQGPQPAAVPPGLADRVLRLGANLGFAGGTNAGIAAGDAGLVAMVNDDLVVAPGWLATLRAALEAEPKAAAAQGVNLVLEEGAEARADGCGIAWNGSWQAVQRGHLQPAPGPGAEAEEVLGVSATAALYRREALAAVALAGGEVLDPRLGSYYEDVDLACRLRAAGFTALLVPAARAHHAGSVTGKALGRKRLRLLYGNRYLVLARLLGGRFGRHLPAILGRDLRDLAAATLRGDVATVTGVASGLARAVRHLPAYLRRGPAAVPEAELRRFRVAA